MSVAMVCMINNTAIQTDTGGADNATSGQPDDCGDGINSTTIPKVRCISEVNKTVTNQQQIVAEENVSFKSEIQ